VKRLLRPGREESLLLKPGIAVIVVLFHLLFTDIAFKFLFIPMIIAGVAGLKRILDGRTGFHLLGWYLPLILVAVLSVLHYHHQLYPGRQEIHAGKTIKVLSYNIFYDGGHEDRLKVIETIRKENADIFCCIEFNFQKDGALFAREIGELYPYTLTSDYSKYSKSGSIIFSKYPIRYFNLRNQKKMPQKWSSKVSIIFAELDVDGRKVNLVNYHLKSVGHYIEYVADKDFPVRAKIDWAAKNEEKNDREKAVQAEFLVKLMSESTNPTILCGDLNDTPNSRVFQVLEKSYKNAFSDRGWGLGATFGEARILDNLGWIPFISYVARDLIRIDHIFVSKDIRVHSARVITDAHGSDHKPVVSTIELE
jgi:endonuclease/exonuclease/phosphatase family metal-dependent hydrolase